MTKYFLFLFVALAAMGCKKDEDTPEILVPVYFHVECAAKINSGVIGMNDQEVEFSDTGTYVIHEPAETKSIYVQYGFLTSPGNQDVKITITTASESMVRHHTSNIGPSVIEKLNLH